MDQKKKKAWTKEDESRWELAGMSVSSTLIARSNEQWELHESWRESFFFFRFPCFCSFSSPLLFLRLLTLVKLLTVRVITPTVTCRWYVIIFSFYLLLMGNNLEIACFCNSLRFSYNSDDRSNEPNPSLTLIKIWTSSKLMKVHESWWELVVKRERELRL